MKRLALIATFVLAAGILAGSASAARPCTTGSPSYCVAEANGPAFPTKTYLVTLNPPRALTVHDVAVTENGGPVAEMKLEAASKASKTTFGTVLVLDASYSMNGAPIAAAVAAAQKFVDQANPNAQIGVIEFNRDVTPVQGLTTSKGTVSAALGKPPTISTGTHIYDAVAQAESMLERAGIKSGSIVLLSDGADHGSTKTLKQVGDAANKAKIQIYTIGLADKAYNPGTLNALADAGNGTYAQAQQPKKLSNLFEQLSQQISNEYLLQYKSLLGSDTRVRVKVQVSGAPGTAVVGYTTAALPTPPPPAPYHKSIGNRIESSPLTMIVLALLAAAVVAILVIGLAQPKRSNLPARMAEFVSIRGLQRDKGQAATAIPEEAAADQSTYWTRFQDTLEIADIKTTPETIVLGTVVLTALTFLLIYAATGSPWWALFALGVPYLVREWVVRTLARRRNRFAEQLPDALQVVASALRSGHSFAGALAVVVESASEPMKSEMQRVVADEQLGIPMERSLLVVAERMDSRDVEQLSLVAELQREAGGNAAEVVDRVAETVRERFDLKRLINTLTMQGRMSRWIVSALPIGIILILQVESPHYLHPLLASTAGRIVFALAAAWAVAGSFVIKKIVEIEV